MRSRTSSGFKKPYRQNRDASPSRAISAFSSPSMGPLPTKWIKKRAPMSSSSFASRTTYSGCFKGIIRPAQIIWITSPLFPAKSLSSSYRRSFGK